MTDCREFDAQLRALKWGSPEFDAWVREQRDVAPCVAEGLRRTREQGDWRGFEIYMSVASVHPSRAYTQTLCEVLDERRDDMDAEGIVDVLDPIKDPAAVPALRRTLRWIPDWDEYGQTARKAVWALSSINTPEAIAAIREEVTPDLPFKVVEAAEAALR